MNSIASEMLKVLAVGGCAGSPYNVQPWRFRISGNRIEVFLEQYQGGLWELPLIYQATLGCLVENLVEGARSVGFAASYNLLSERPGLERPMLELTLEPDDSENRPDVTHIRARYTNRKPYFEKPVPPEIIREVSRHFSTESASVRDFGNNEPFIRHLCRLEWVRAQNAACSDELFAHLRGNVEDAERERDLLDVRVLQFNFMERISAHLCLRSWFYRRLFELCGSAYIVEAYQRRLLFRTPSILVFRDKEHGFAAIVECWRRIQNVLNYLSLRGLSSQLVLAGLDILKLPAARFSPRERDVMDSTRGQLERLLGDDIENFAAVLRVGYADPCAVRSLRIEPENLIIQEQIASAGKRLSVI